MSEGRKLTDEELREELKFEQADADALKALSRATNPARGAFAMLGAMKTRLEAGHPKIVKDAQPDLAPIVIIIENAEDDAKP